MPYLLLRWKENYWNKSVLEKCLAFLFGNVLSSGRKVLINNKGVIATKKEAAHDLNGLLPKM